MEKRINPRQKEAIETVEGPVLIIAGPGTGKTFTLVERVIHMVLDRGIDPSSIMISTFTNKAARELLDRLSIEFREKNIGKDVNDMMLGNFHSICRKILDKYIDYLGISKDYRLIDDFEKKYLISRQIDSFRRIDGYSSLVRGDEISFITRIIQLVFEEGIVLKNSERKDFQLILDIARQYEKILIENNLLDFSAQLYFTYKIIVENKEVKEELKEQISYIMIDEYQDTNTIQEKIIFSILNDRENICVVGDDDQGLYRFRGASVKNILNFGKNLTKPVKRVDLNVNYRSKKSIIDFYSSFMGQLDSLEDIDKYRYDKDLVAFDKDDRQAVYKLTSESEEDFRDRLVHMVKEFKEKGLVNDYNEIAILVSSVNDYRILKLSTGLKKSGIGVYTPKTNQLMSRGETKFLFGALYAIFRPYIEKRKLPIKYDSYTYLNNLYDYYYRQEKKHPDLGEFIGKMQTYIMGDKLSLSLLDIIYRLFRYQPFKGYLDKQESDKERKNISKLMELIESYSYQTYTYRIHSKNRDDFCISFFSNFIGFLKDTKIYEFEEDTVIPEENQLSILTIHSSKGLEYPVVIMASLWDQPYKRYRRAKTAIDLFAEKYAREEFEPFDQVEKLDYYRKYFTGFSRAKKLLVLAGIESESYKSLGSEIQGTFNSLPEIEDLDPKELSYEKEPVAKEKGLYSYTKDLVQYNHCPKSYYFFRKLKYRKELGLGQVYGTMVHEGIEYINKKLIDGNKVDSEDLKDYIYDIARVKYRRGAIGLNKSIIESALEELDKYLEFSPRFPKILESELEISLAKDDYILTGNIDMVFEDKRSINIVDFKTGKNPQENSDIDLLDSYLGQISLYAYLFQATKEKKIDNIALYFTSMSNRESYICRKNNENNLINTISSIERTINDIENDRDFKKTQDKSKCKNCELRFYCDRLE